MFVVACDILVREAKRTSSEQISGVLLVLSQALRPPIRKNPIFIAIQWGWTAAQN